MKLNIFHQFVSNLLPQSAVRGWGIRGASIFGALCLLCTESAWAQAHSGDIQGEWRMDERVRRAPGVMFYEQDLRIFVIDRMDDGSYRVLSTLTIRAVADSEGRIGRPECAGKKECIYDDGSEGIGRLVGNKFYVDWLDDAWIDDVYTIDGDRMSGHDGNAPLDFRRVE